MPSFWDVRRKRFFAWHALLSLTLAAVCGGAVLVLYPESHFILSGGRDLLLILLGVDVVLGPLLTLFIVSPGKPQREAVRDVGMLVLMQLAALLYGLHTAYAGRPIAVVFEVDRFKVVAANEVFGDELAQAPDGYRVLPVAHVWWLGARPAASNDEALKSIDMAMQGYDIGQRPSFWQPYDLSKRQAARVARPVETLIHTRPAVQASVDGILSKRALPVASASFLPLDGRKGTWSVLLTHDGTVLGVVPHHTEAR